MRELSIKIDCDYSTCGKCRFLAVDGYFNGKCLLFKKDIEEHKLDDNYRLNECMSSEVINDF